MAVQNRTTLKSYFETGDTPTQAQYGDTLDSTWLKSETLPSDVVFYDTLADLPATGAAGVLYVVHDVDTNDTQGLRIWYEGTYQNPVQDVVGALLADGNYGDVTVSGIGTAININADAVGLDKQASGTANRLQGFDASGNPSEMTAGAGITIASGVVSATAVPGPYAGDVTAAAGGVAVGQIYRLSQVNDYDMASPEGRAVVTRIA